jgi:hypothetical protein
MADPAYGQTMVHNITLLLSWTRMDTISKPFLIQSNNSR